jgi:hypothetical protein
MSRWVDCWPLPTMPGPSTGLWRWIPRSPVLTNTPRTSPATQGTGSNYTNLASEPPDRGGLTSKIHRLVDRRGRSLVVLVGAGQAHDGPVLEPLLAHLKVDRCRGGRPRTRPARIRGDKAYAGRATRARLRQRGIVAVIPEPSDQIARRKRRGARGGRPPNFNAEDVMARRGEPLRQTHHRLPRRSSQDDRVDGNVDDLHLKYDVVRVLGLIPERFARAGRALCRRHSNCSRRGGARYARVGRIPRALHIRPKGDGGWLQATPRRRAGHGQSARQHAGMATQQTGRVCFRIGAVGLRKFERGANVGRRGRVGDDGSTWLRRRPPAPKSR